MLFLKTCYKAYFYHSFFCLFAGSPYLCTVLFMVLDLRLTKVGVQRYSFFYVCTFLLSVLFFIEVILLRV